jgi:hypothetical protein
MEYYDVRENGSDRQTAAVRAREVCCVEAGKEVNVGTTS